MPVTWIKCGLFCGLCGARVLTWKKWGHGAKEERSMSECPSAAADRHNRELDMEAELAIVDQLTTAVVTTLPELNTGRNKECFPLSSFGWKDADLDPEGCCGIKDVVVADDRFVVTVGGHKTVCSPVVESEYDLTSEDEKYFGDIAQELVSGAACAGDWTGDDWSLRFEDEVLHRFTRREMRRLSYWPSDSKEWALECAKIVRRVAWNATRFFREEMASLSEAMDMLYEEVRSKYDTGNQSV